MGPGGSLGISFWPKPGSHTAITAIVKQKQIIKSFAIQRKSLSNRIEVQYVCQKVIIQIRWIQISKY